MLPLERGLRWGSQEVSTNTMPKRPTTHHPLPIYTPAVWGMGS